MSECDDETHLSLTIYVLGIQRYGLLILASISSIVNFAFLILVIKGCQSEEMPTKRFLFVLNRSGADLITSGVTLFYLIMSLSAPCLEDPHFGCTTKESLLHPLPLQMIVSLDFYLVATSYCGVALLIVYAVRNPIIYKIRVTVRHVYASIMGSWVLLLLALSAIYANHGFNESFDSNGMIYIMLHGYHGEISYWQSDVCTNLARQEPLLLGIVSLAIPCILLLMATGSYILVARALCTRQQSGLHQNALLRLGMHLGLFAFTVVLMSSTYFVSTPLASFCKYGSQNQDSCGFKPFASYSFLTAVTSFGWYLRMSLDPIIDVVIDVTLRRLLLKRPRHRLSTYTLSTEMGVFLLLLVAVVSGYPYSSYNGGYYNRFGDYMMPGRTDYYSTSSGAFYPTYGFSSYAAPPVATVNHGFGDYYRGYGNGPSAYGATDGRFGYPLRPGFSGSYPLLTNDFPSPLDRSFNLRFPFKKQ